MPRIWLYMFYIFIINCNPESYCRYGYFENSWWSLGQIVENLQITNKLFFQNVLNLAEVWISTPHRLAAGANWETSSCSEHSSWQVIGIWPRIHFSEQRLMHRLPSTITFPKMLHFRCQFENFADTYIFLMFTHLY